MNYPQRELVKYHQQHQYHDEQLDVERLDTGTKTDSDQEQGHENTDGSDNATTLDAFEDEEDDGDLDLVGNDKDVMEISEMNGSQRFQLVLSLWPYMIPLFTVYVAEYALQSGTWTAIGFPVTDELSRDNFFEYSNWMYQVGVFLSRSSGTIFTAPMAILWLMPILQVANAGIYWFIAATQEVGSNFFHSPAFLYSTALYAGLLGGAVYIHGYLRICKDLPFQHREFALSATSVAEGLGILVADLLGLLIQACLYQINGLDGAVLTCPAKSA
jgi:battenin